MNCTQSKFTRIALLGGVVVVITLLVSTSGCKVAEEAKGVVYGLEEYVYGFPLVLMDITKDKVTAASKAGEYTAPMNQFCRIRTYVSPDYKDVVRISVNSLWSDGFLDLENEPMVVTLPDTGNRYVVMQAMNMWTDNFMSVGTRTPEAKFGNFLIAGPKWNGTAPADVKATFRCSTRYAWVLVQMSCPSPAEYPEINALQDQLKITPLSAWGKPYTPPDNVPINANVDTTATPYDQVRLMTGTMFFKRLAQALKDNPPYPADTAALEKLKKIGVEPGKDFDPSKIDPEVLKGINKTPPLVWMEFATGPYSEKTVNGWLYIMNLGRYGTDYKTRAFVAYVGLGALCKEDAIYPSCFVDGDGKVLDGADKYVMHFDKGQLPPSNAGVWSISQYREN
jgi:hypothetical protein